MLKIKLKEGELYYIRYFTWTGKLRHFHGYLEKIFLDTRQLYFDREGLGNKSVHFDKICTVHHIKSKGERVLYLLSGK